MASSREEAVRLLKLVRKRICSYSRSSMCDCKYGASMQGEQTGCPEIRDVIDFFENMTDTEYKKILKRSEKQIAKKRKEYIKAGGLWGKE